MNKKIEQFNIVIVGTGGQGLITLLQVIAEAALAGGYDVKTSELHGLSQRGGSVEVHIRFGKKIYSPMVPLGEADLVIALELQESLRAIKFINPKSNFLISDQIIPIPSQKTLETKEIISLVAKTSKNVKLLPAFSLCKEKFGTGVMAGIYLISFAAFKGILPLSTQLILEAVKKVIPSKYLDLNIKTFDLARDYEKK
jgi:indolepyruvate ferredoxin oxidoreductase beta subunit